MAGKYVAREDNITLAETRKIAATWPGTGWALCSVCYRPMLYRLGVTKVPPLTCGRRIPCMREAREEGWEL